MNFGRYFENISQPLRSIAGISKNIRTRTTKTIKYQHFSEIIARGVEVTYFIK
jgi:hypothetical protein